MPYQIGDWHEFPHTHNYDDDLREMIALMKELRDAYAKLVSEIDKLGDEFNEIKSAFANVLVEFNKFEDEVQNLNRKVDRNYEEQQADIDALFKLYNTLFDLYADLNNLIDAKIELYDVKNKKYILNIITPINNEIAEIKEELARKQYATMYNRVEGTVDEIRKVINDYYENLRTHSLNAAEFGQLQYTVEKYDEFNITAREYATQSKDILNYYFRHNEINPYTGLKNSIYNINSWHTTEHLSAISVNDYAALDLSADDFAALGKNVIECYTLTGEAQYVKAGGDGITATEYTTLYI